MNADSRTGENRAKIQANDFAKPRSTRYAEAAYRVEVRPRKPGLEPLSINPKAEHGVGDLAERGNIRSHDQIAGLAELSGRFT